MSIAIRVLGIYREEKYSNRAIEADKAILDSVLRTLKKQFGNAVAISVLSAEEISNRLVKFDFNYDLIFSMAQGEGVLNIVDKMQKDGAVVVNSGAAIRNCYRGKLSELLSDAVFSYPRYTSLKVTDKIFGCFNSASGYWVKRGDFHALVDEDVIHIQSVDDLASVLDQFKNRGVKEIILQENCQGELFKFYGVRDSFFNLRHMGRTGTNRYEFNPGNSSISFDQIKLEKLVHKAAAVLDLDYFGGDCIITPSGRMHFIDFNDWPSFRTCIDEVSPVMVSYAINKLNGGMLNDTCINQ